MKQKIHVIDTKQVEECWKELNETLDKQNENRN